MSLIQELTIDEQYKFVGIDREQLRNCLRKMGKMYLKGKAFKESWTPENPTRNYCYVVSEMVYWYFSPEGTTPYSLVIPGDPGLHRFLRWPDGTLVDLTSDQFPHKLDYSKAKVRMFLQTGCKGPSSRAKYLASLMGFDDMERRQIYVPVQRNGTSTRGIKQIQLEGS